MLIAFSSQFQSLFTCVLNKCWLCRDLNLYLNRIWFIRCEWHDSLSLNSRYSSSPLSSTSRMSKAHTGNPKCLVFARMPKRSEKGHCFRRSLAGCLLTDLWKPENTAHVYCIQGFILLGNYRWVHIQDKIFKWYVILVASNHGWPLWHIMEVPSLQRISVQQFLKIKTPYSCLRRVQNQRTWKILGSQHLETLVKKCSPSGWGVWNVFWCMTLYFHERTDWIYS